MLWIYGLPISPLGTFMIVLYFTLSYFSYFSDPYDLFPKKGVFVSKFSGKISDPEFPSEELSNPLPLCSPFSPSLQEPHPQHTYMVEVRGPKYFYNFGFDPQLLVLVFFRGLAICLPSSDRFQQSRYRASLSFSWFCLFLDGEV